MSGKVRVYVAGKGVSLDATATALDALRILDPAEATRVEGGEMLMVDSRGLPISPASGVFNGAIYRVVRNRTSDPG